ncbi:hypothetical protein [Candidatus Pelagibacter communis]|uniref:hypothetical protein n=1 Tax=Pelagibacter ubique TaxID=198252 RepID=UPI000AD0031D|nr:hypothetical protein [Candidatus Pelagibacter ubique]
MEGSSVEAIISAADIQPIVDQLLANVEVIVPVGLVIMSTMIGISLIPRILYKFL